MEKNILIDEYKMLLFYLTKSHVSSIFLYTILKLFAQHDSNKIYMYFRKNYLSPFVPCINEINFPMVL